MDRAPRLERSALVVDDDVFVLSALAEVLSEEGYDVHTASNGFSAMRQAAEVRPAVILLDLALPERSGNEVLAELRCDAATRDVAIVIVTGHPERLSDALLEEADGVVGKPFDVPELLSIVHRAVQRASTRQAEVAPVATMGHREPAARTRRGTGVRHTRHR
jgi:two-component system KDP operon response regulator KdpE